MILINHVKIFSDRGKQALMNKTIALKTDPLSAEYKNCPLQIVLRGYRLPEGWANNDNLLLKEEWCCDRATD